MPLIQLEPFTKEVNRDEVPYQEAVGSLQYLVLCSRPDIANAVRTLGKYLNCYTKVHFVMAKRVMRYLKGTSSFGTVWIAPRSPPKELKMVAYADADLGNDQDNRKSITGYVLQVNGYTIAYKSRKQSLVTDDTCSAEFVAASECSKVVIWAHNLCEELGLNRGETVLMQDNQSTIEVLQQVRSHFRVKSVDLKYHKVRNLVERGIIRVEYCPSQDMIARHVDEASGFVKLRELLNVKDTRQLREEIRLERERQA